MSYDFELFRPTPGMDLNQAAERWMIEQEASLVAGSAEFDQSKDDAKKQLSKILIERNPALIPNEYERPSLADSGKSKEQDPVKRPHDIQLDGGENSNGIQISLSDDSAGITVPYWHSGTKAKVVFREIWDYLEILENKGGFRTFDPQIGRVLELQEDIDVVLSAYEGTMVQVASIAGRHQKPWWQFW